LNDQVGRDRFECNGHQKFDLLHRGPIALHAHLFRSPSKIGRPQNCKEQNKYALGTMARRSLRQRTTSELQDVIRFFCLDRGCQHARGESYLAFGGLDLTNDVEKTTNLMLDA
jgi:hypothetical protein